MLMSNVVASDAAISQNPGWFNGDPVNVVLVQIIFTMAQNQKKIKLFNGINGILIAFILTSCYYLSCRIYARSSTQEQNQARNRFILSVKRFMMS